MERELSLEEAKQQEDHSGRQEERETSGGYSGESAVAAVPVIAEAVLNVVGAEHCALRLHHLVVPSVHAVSVPPHCWHLQPVQR